MKFEHLVESVFESYIGSIVEILNVFVNDFWKIADCDEELSNKNCLTLGFEFGGSILVEEKPEHGTALKHWFPCSFTSDTDGPLWDNRHY